MGVRLMIFAFASSLVSSALAASSVAMVSASWCYVLNSCLRRLFGRYSLF